MKAAQAPADWGIVKPIFIVGVGRSGSTIFHRIFVEHPTVAWLSSRLCDAYPDRPSLNAYLMKAIDYPVGGRFLRKRFTTGEGWDFWDYHCKGFSTPCRDLYAEDVTNRVREAIPKAMSQILTPKRNRLLIKITGWPRIGFLHEIFPDAKFIHVKRELGAVVNSMLNVNFWEGWRGPHNWKWGELTPAQRQEWEHFDRSFVALAAIEVQMLIDAMETAKQCVNQENFMEVTYEGLCASPVRTFAEVFDFCELGPVPALEQHIQRHGLQNRNDKWKQELTESQKRILEHFRAQSTCRQSEPEGQQR